MANLVNHRCQIRKKQGSLSQEDLTNIIKEIENQNYVYSNYYVSINKCQLNIEYVAKYYPMVFFDDEKKGLLDKFSLIDVIADDGGGIDAINPSQDTYTAFYKFNEIQINGRIWLNGIENDDITNQNERHDVINVTGKISACTFNEEITSIGISENKIIITDDIFNRKMVKESFGIWSIEANDTILADRLAIIIKTITIHPKKRNFDYLSTIKFLFDGKIYFEITWNDELQIWESKRRFNLWEILIIK